MHYILYNLESKSTKTRLCQSGIYPAARAMESVIGVHPCRRGQPLKRGQRPRSQSVFCSEVLYTVYIMQLGIKGHWCTPMQKRTTSKERTKAAVPKCLLFGGSTVYIMQLGIKGHWCTLMQKNPCLYIDGL